MSHDRTLRSSLGVLSVTAAMLMSGSASASAATSACASPAVTQPFASLAISDSNWYAAVPGESYDNFAGTGWTLSGGAQIVETTLQDGTEGEVLDLPSGATAVSPAMCVNNSYPYARAMVRDVEGLAGVKLSVAYMGTSTWGAPQASDTILGLGDTWVLTRKLSINPGTAAGWEIAQFTLSATGTANDTEIYNLYVDPRMKS